MAYEVIILYHLHMPLYFTGTFTEYLPFTDPTGLFMFMRISYSLERQIILLVCRGKVYRRSGSSIHGRKRSIRRNRPLGTHTLYFPRTDTVEPNAHSTRGHPTSKNTIQLFTCLNIKLRYLICSKYVKTHFFRILIMRFNYVFLYFPFISCL